MALSNPTETESTSSSDPALSGPDAIEVQNLTKWYGDFLAVGNISFTVKQGEILGFLGPNGAGKTTTIRIMTCFMPASSGTVRVGGFDVFRQSIEVRRNIGYMPENTPLYPELRVKEYLKFRAAIKGVPRSERASRIDHVTETCAIADVQHRIIGQLSKGYRQRVGLADALVADPKILILDEPLASLDPNQQAHSKEVIRGLKGDHTIIFSTHILADVEEICDRMVIINRGRLVAQGTPDELAKGFQDETDLLAEVFGPADDVRSAVEAIEGVRSVNARETDGLVILSIKADADRDVREEVSKTIIQNNWRLREIRSKRMELAEIFGRLTEGR